MKLGDKTRGLLKKAANELEAVSAKLLDAYSFGKAEMNELCELSRRARVAASYVDQAEGRLFYAKERKGRKK